MRAEISRSLISGAILIGSLLPCAGVAQPAPAQANQLYYCSVVNTNNSGGNITLNCSLTPPHEDAIKQNGYEVGQAYDPRYGPGGVIFGAMDLTPDFNERSDFQYHDQTYGNCQIMGGNVSATMPGQSRPSRTLTGVFCSLKSPPPSP